MDVVSLAFRYIVSRKIALISLIFITIGVTANIVVVAVMDGFQERIRLHLRGTEADLTITPKVITSFEQFAQVSETLKGEMESAGGEIVALAPHQVAIAVVGLAGGLSDPSGTNASMQGVRVVGIDFAREKEVVPFRKLLTDLAPRDERLRVPPERLDDPFADLSLPGVLLGVSLARELRVARGDTVEVLIPRMVRDKNDKPVLESSNLSFQLIGCFDSGREDYDSTFVYMTLKDFGRLQYNGMSNHVDCRTVQARVRDAAMVETLKKRIEADHAGLQVSTWEDKNAALLGAIRTEKAMIVIILFFIVAIAAGSILGILYMMVIEKTRDIGVLRSMGLSRRRVVAVFMSCGALIGLIGSLIGLGLGLLVVHNLNDITGFIADKFGVEVFSARIYKFTSIPTRLVPSWVGGTVGVAFLLAVVAGVIPALMAARLDPVRCLKDE